MLTKEIIDRVLAAALAAGGDFAEIYAENTLKNNLAVIDAKVDSALCSRDFGVGIRVLKGNKCVYASTNDISEGRLIELAKQLGATFKTDKYLTAAEVVRREFKSSHPFIYAPSTVDIQRKVAVTKAAYNSAKKYSSDVSQVQVNFIDWDSDILIANSEGLLVGDRRVYTRLYINAIASAAGENQVGTEGPGRRMGFEVFEKAIDPAYYGEIAAKQAVTMLHAKECPSGRMQVAIENGFGGVIFHEACGHSLEATSVAKGNSEFCGKLGQQIANQKVTAIDDATIPNAWGSIDVDDEGTVARKNVLIENGILKGYLVDKLGGRMMGMESTGSARRQSYEYAPTSRMSNTYIANGPDKNEDIIRSMHNGLYARKMGGGSVNPVTGDFNFSVSEGYIVRNGEICEPVRGASLIGKGSDVLMKIDMVGQNLDHGQGMCGSSSGSVPVNVGQPLIRVSDITVGGKD